MINLNSTNPIKEKKIRPGRGIGSGKGTLLDVATKVKNQEEVLLLRVLKVVKCLYIEDSQK